MLFLLLCFVGSVWVRTLDLYVNKVPKRYWAEKKWCQEWCSNDFNLYSWLTDTHIWIWHWWVENQSHCTDCSLYGVLTWAQDFGWKPSVFSFNYQINIQIGPVVIIHIHAYMATVDGKPVSLYWLLLRQGPYWVFKKSLITSEINQKSWNKNWIRTYFMIRL